MAVNYIVHSECDAKRTPGDGDHLKGTVHILALLKARDRAAAMRNEQSPEGLSLIVRTVNADGMFPDRKSSADTKDPVRYGDEQ